MGEFTKYDTRGAYHWDEIGQRLPNRYSARMHALYSWFEAEVRRRRPRLLVDVGCGDAALTHRLALASGGTVVGIEPEPAGVAMATQALQRAGSNATVSQGRGEALPYADDEVDVVVMCEVVEHLTEADVQPLLAEAARVLSADGALLVSTPQWQKPELRRFHVREYRGDELAALLGGSFARVGVRVSEPGGLQDAYQQRRTARIGVNVLSQLGANPFRVWRAATPERAGWRQLVAVAERPLD